MAFKGGPYVQVACFCDMVIEDKSGVLSLIRIIDTLTHTETGPNPPADMPSLSYPMKLVLMLKAGTARGRSELKIVPELPTGEQGQPITMTVHFEGEERGQNVVVNMTYTFDVEGLYWFRVYVDDEHLTAIPLRVRYNRLVSGTAQPG